MQPHSQSRRGIGMFVSGAMATLLVVNLWQGISAPPPAYGQVPDSGHQRQMMIDELRTANKRLTEMAALLKQIRDGKPTEKTTKHP